MTPQVSFHLCFCFGLLQKAPFGPWLPKFLFLLETWGVFAAAQGVLQQGRCWAGAALTSCVYSCRFPGLPVVCGLLLPGKPVAEDDADQGVLAGRRRRAGSDHLLLLLRHHLGERSPGAEGGEQK